MAKYKYFDRPAQVMFKEPYQEDTMWISGIAYRNKIICSCCGGIFNIDEVNEDAAECGFEEAIFPYTDWMNLHEAVFGGEYPSDFAPEDDYIDGDICDEEAATAESFSEIKEKI